MTAVRVTAQIALFGAALADSQQTEAGAHIGGSASLLLPQGSGTFGDLSAEVTGPG